MYMEWSWPKLLSHVRRQRTFLPALGVQKKNSSIWSISRSDRSGSDLFSGSHFNHETVERGVEHRARVHITSHDGPKNSSTHCWLLAAVLGHRVTGSPQNYFEKVWKTKFEVWHQVTRKRSILNTDGTTPTTWWSRWPFKAVKLWNLPFTPLQKLLHLLCMTTRHQFPL